VKRPSVQAIAFVPFARNVLHLDLSPAWRVLLLIAIDGVQPRELEGEDREIARQLFGDIEEVSEAARRVLVWRLGRASGKTTLAAALGVWIMLTAPLVRVGPGMLAAVVVVAPGRPTAKLSVGVARELVRRTPSLERLVVDEGDTADGFSLRRPDGRRVYFVAVAASRGGTTLRGYDILALILDESEFLASNSDATTGDGYAVNDRDLFNAAKPRLHGPAIFISTPWPVENLTAELFDKNHDRPSTALAALGVSTFMRPDDDRLARDVAQGLLDDPDNAAREFLCQPGARGGSRLFDAASIEGAILEGRPLVIAAPEGAAVGCGGDLGLERDSSAIAAVSSLGGAFELLEFDEIKPTKDAPLAPGYVIRDRFAPVMRRHGVTSITMDGHYRQSAVEHLDAEGLGFDPAPEGQQGKYDSYMFVRGLLRTGKLKIPAVPRLIAQLRAVTSTALPGGGTKITSPRRMGQGHGDIVSSLVLGCWALREDALPSWISAMTRWRAAGAKPPFAASEGVGDAEKPEVRLQFWTSSPKSDGSGCAGYVGKELVGEARWLDRLPGIVQFTDASTPEFKALLFAHFRDGQSTHIASSSHPKDTHS
jgi:hypothetical protein